MTDSNASNKPAWVQLYEARRAAAQVMTRNPGRPPASIPRHKVGVTLSQGEIVELEAWQERFSSLLSRKVSTGETMGILVRTCSARYTYLPESKKSTSELESLVEAMIGKD